MTKEGQDNLNKFLAEKYGSLYEKPRFRVVWSTDQMEVRKSEFINEVDGLVLGTVIDTRKVPKYSYCMDRWVLEEIILSAHLPKELVDRGPVGYEPIYVFWTGEDGDYQEPDLFHVDQMCHFRANNTLRNHAPTQEQLRKNRKKQEALNRAKIREQLDEALPDTAHAIVHGEGIVMDSRKRFEDA